LDKPLIGKSATSKALRRAQYGAEKCQKEHDGNIQQHARRKWFWLQLTENASDNLDKSSSTEPCVDQSGSLIGRRDLPPQGGAHWRSEEVSDRQGGDSPV